jgi:hypothetical protein
MKLFQFFFLNILKNTYTKIQPDFLKNKDISVNLSTNNTIINKLSGFYGMIGADIDNNINSLYDMVMGNGVIQGIHFGKNITFIRSYVKTDKFSDKNLLKIHDMFDISNTNIMNVNGKLFSLFEMNRPYELRIHNDSISTLKKVKGNINFSGHSKHINNKIETMDYNFMLKTVNYYEFDNDFNLEKTNHMHFEYHPIVHDFGIVNNKRIFLDSSFTMNVLQRVIYLDKKKSLFHILDKDDSTITKYEIDDAFYIFHYAYVEESHSYIYIYASLYDTIHFSNLDLKGKYRKIMINKKSKKVYIVKTDELEQYNLDFPIKFEDKIILRNVLMDDKRINGFVITKELTVIKTLFFDDLSIYGEHTVKYIDETPYLLFYAYKSNTNYFVMLNLKNDKMEYLEIPCKLNIGFHSIFIDSQ